MTYEEIKTFLDAHLPSVAMMFDRYIEEECEVLAGCIGKSARDTTRADAQSYYAEDVSDYLDGHDLSPATVLNHRRRATAWAVARYIIAEQKRQERAAEAAKPEAAKPVG